jgi:hypothetical protein
MDRTEAQALMRQLIECQRNSSIATAENAFKPDPVFERWELLPDVIIAHGSRSVIHYGHFGDEKTFASNGLRTKKTARGNGNGREMSVVYRGETVRYHNESFVKRVPFSSIKAILKKGNSILVFEHSYLNSLIVNRNLQYQSRLRSEKFKHPHYHGFASLVLELPKGRPASDYGSALLALCPAANKVDPEIVHLPKSHQRAIWLLNRL